ncbi:MAG: hypothetical protein FWD88_04450 [Treponema sp.]|nr:hypothetical protein [Treponema sp.]
MKKRMFVGKRIAVLLALALVGAHLHAQEGGFVFRPLFNGGGLTAALNGLGGKGEVAILFFDSGLQVGAHIVGRGGLVSIDDDNYGLGSFGAKLSFGGFWPNGVLRSYAFVEGGLGAAGGGDAGAHLAVLFGGGGGIDWLFLPNASLYLEFGYLQHHVNNRFCGGPSISIGARSFF